MERKRDRSKERGLGESGTEQTHPERDRSTSASLDVTPTTPLLIRSEAEARDLFDLIPVPRMRLQKKFPEWVALERISTDLATSGRFEVLGWTEDERSKFPLITATFGNPDPRAPTLGLFGGVHGLERIGSQVVLALMTSFAEMILWDKLFQQALEKLRIVWFPIVNPIGILNKTRANPNGVDLMRNAPVDSQESPTFLVGGHRLSPQLPWFRGYSRTQMEVESQALIEVLKTHVLRSERAITLDFHSGFGTLDRMWFPFARSKTPFPHVAEVHAFKEAFERIHPHHIYRIEPQAKHYTTHGDLWDYAYDLFYQDRATKEDVYLPLAIEMGSWMWVKKNPLQLFSALGPYNPMKAHRLKRILRRHNTLFDFLVRALVSHEVWVPSNPEQREKHHHRGMDTWFPDFLKAEEQK